MLCLGVNLSGMYILCRAGGQLTSFWNYFTSRFQLGPTKYPTLMNLYIVQMVHKYEYKYKYTYKESQECTYCAGRLWCLRELAKFSRLLVCKLRLSKRVNTVSISNFPQACYDQICLPELQNGVQVMIFVAFIIVALVIIYAILYQVVIPPKKVPVAERIRSSTCFRFARKSGWQATLQGTMREDDLGGERFGNFQIKSHVLLVLAVAFYVQIMPNVYLLTY